MNCVYTEPMDDVIKPAELPKIQFNGKINLITNDHELAQAQTGLNSVTQFGFDTETKPSFKKGEVYKVALLQLASPTEAYLIRLQAITQFSILKDVLENENVLKVGVAIRDDLKGLQKHFSFVPKNFVELQDVAKAKGLENFGLKGMTAEVLKASLSKAAKMTNWEQPSLTTAQLLYAATDAWIGLALYLKLQEQKISNWL